MELATKNTTLSVWTYFGLKEEYLKAEDVAAFQKCYSRSVHDNTLNLLSH